MLQNNFQGETIICPHVACIVIYCLYLVSFFYNISYGDTLSIIAGLIIIIVYAAIFFFIHKGIKQRMYRYYFNGFIISIILSIILTILRIIGIISVASIKVSSQTEKQAKTTLIVTYIIDLLIDWIVPGVLFCYKKKVENLCEPSPALNPNNGPLV